MQRKARKQLNKVTQWTNEKVFSGERTELDGDFEEFEKEIEPLRIGVERLHATSVAYYDQLSKLKATADPYPPSGSGKEKLQVSEALGLVMLDYGRDVDESYGDALVKYGNARCRLAELQDQFRDRLDHGYIRSTKESLALVEDYKSQRKKMESRRLTLDAALNRLKSSKKENPQLEEEVESAQLRLEHATEDTKLTMQAIKKHEAEQFAALVELLDAEWEYFSACKKVIGDLRGDFPKKYQPSTRARAESTDSYRTAGRTPTRAPAARRDTSEESPLGGRQAALRAEAEEDTPGRKRAGSKSDAVAAGRDRSDSAASAGKGKRFMSSIGSIGSFGMAAASAGGKMASKAGKSAKGGFGKTKYGNISDEERRAVTLDDDDDDHSPSISSRPSFGSRARSQSVISVVSGLAPPDTQATRRRALTSPPSPNGQLVKVLFDYVGQHNDELSLQVGQIVEVKQEISSDWLIGECDGHSGLFPRAYTEPHVPPAVDAVTPRRLPPRAGTRQRSRSPTSMSMTSDAESDADPDHSHHDNAATSLWSAQQATPKSSATPQSGRSRAGSLQKKAAPPPPPSRRTTSSNNLSTIAAGRPGASRSRSSTVSRAAAEDRIGTPPRVSPHATADSSPFVGARSPFEHSDDEDTHSLSNGVELLHVR